MRLDVKIKNAGYKNKSVLENINFSIDKNSLTAVIGRNGSGKSTLLSVLAALIDCDGDIFLDLVPIRSLSRRELSVRISAMLQYERRPHITVRELVAFGRSPHLKLGGKMTYIDRKAIERAVELADISGLLDSYVDKISGGEARRAYYAMLLAQDTDIVLLDEPTAFMDADYERSFFELSKNLSKTKTVIAVIHNINLALQYADYILLLDGGRSLFYGKTEELLATDLIEKIFSVKRFSINGTTYFI